MTPAGEGERRRILDMLAEGRLSAEQAAALLDALDAAGPRPPPPPGPPPPPRARGGSTPRPPARLIRIRIDVREPGREPVNVNVSVPLALARFAARFLPADARSELDRQGVDLGRLLSGLESDLPDGPLVDLDASEDAADKTVRIRVDVA